MEQLVQPLDQQKKGLLRQSKIERRGRQALHYLVREIQPWAPNALDGMADVANCLLNVNGAKGTINPFIKST
jgi:hypothetical protein